MGCRRDGVGFGWGDVVRGCDGGTADDADFSVGTGPEVRSGVGVAVGFATEEAAVGIHYDVGKIAGSALPEEVEVTLSVDLGFWMAEG